MPIEMSDQDELSEVVSRQIDYYKAKAGQYDRLGPSGDQQDPRDGQKVQDSRASQSDLRLAESLEIEIEQVEQAFAGVELGNDVLEFACGTGNWTARILERAHKVTCVEASIEMATIALAKMGPDAQRVRLVVTDLFEFEPDQVYDSVVFGFWISHVPVERLNRFCKLVSECLKVGGTLFFVDDKQAIGANQDSLSSKENRTSRLETRIVDSGETFQVVKNFWSPQDLVDVFDAHNIQVKVSETDQFFLFGSGVRLA